MFKVGQKVWCAMFGEGEVMKIIPNNTCYPVEVSFGDSAPEYYTLGGKFYSYANHTLFPYPVEIVKKVAKPSINWEHVDSKFNYLAEDANGDAFLYEKEPFITMTAFGSRGGEIAEVHMFASYVKGTCDWKESLVKRPEGNSHDD
jgi:hypothetical protein